MNRKTVFVVAYICLQVFGLHQYAYSQQYVVNQKQIQEIDQVADSIRIAENIPEICYAVFTDDKVISINAIGVKNIQLQNKADLNDWIHIGSNAKAILGFIAAGWVEKGKINWGTKFFDLYPELKTSSNAVYWDISLESLFSHHAGILPFHNQNELSKAPKYVITDSSARYEFGKWVLNQKPVSKNGQFNYSNAGYVLACLMIEKIAKKSWEQLLIDFTELTGIHIFIGYPSQINSDQPMGYHGTKNNEMGLEFPLPSYFYPSGNISVPLKDYVKFLQSNLAGLHNKENQFLKQPTFEYLFYGVPVYSIGWAWKTDLKGNHIATHNGSEGHFFCHTYLMDEKNIGIVSWGNLSSEKADKALVFLRKRITQIILGE